MSERAGLAYVGNPSPTCGVFEIQGFVELAVGKLRRARLSERPPPMAVYSTENAFELSELSVGRVLLVDDQPELRRVFRRGLVAAGFEVVEAGDGLVALELARRGEFEVVISDVCMPRLGGLGLLVQLAQDVPLLPVLLVSGLSGFADVETARHYGAFDCLEKPLAISLLRARASRAIEAYRMRLAQIELRSSETRLIAAAPLVTDGAKRSALGK